MTKFATITICLVSAGFGLAGCGGGERLPATFAEGSTPVALGAATYLVEPVSEGRRALAASADATASEEGARAAVLSAYADLCPGGAEPELRLFSAFIQPDGLREWSYLATCPATAPA
jgi:hypothetical protein